MIALFVITLVLLFCATAQASVVNGPSQFQAWADEAKVPTPPTVTIAVDDGGCDPGFYLCTTGTVIHWPSWLTGRDDARGWFLHELGHVYDNTTLTHRARYKIMATFKIAQQGALWLWPYRFGESFAQGYAMCALGVFPIPDYLERDGTAYDYRPAQWRHKRLCGLVRKNP